MVNQLPEHLWATRKGVGHKFLKALIALGAATVAGSLLFLAYTSIFDGSVSTRTTSISALGGTSQNVSPTCASGITPYDFDRSKGITTHIFNPGAQCNYGFDVVKGQVEFLDIRGDVVEFTSGTSTFKTIGAGQRVAARNQRVTTIRAVSDTAKVDTKLCVPPTEPVDWVCVRR